MLLYFVLLLSAVSVCFAEYCITDEAWRRFRLPIKFHKGPGRKPAHIEHLTIKKDDAVIVNILPDNTLWGNSSYNIYGYIDHIHANAYVIFKTAYNDNTGVYKFMLFTGWNAWETIGIEEEFNPDRSVNPPPRISEDPINIIKQHNGISCGNNPALRKSTIWYILLDGTLQILRTSTPFIHDDKISGFTKVYCDLFKPCGTSNIINSDGITEDLTWETDYRHTKTGFGTTIKNIIEYNTSKTNWYVLKNKPPNLGFYKDDEKIFTISKPQYANNIKDSGVSLNWIGDQIRLEFSDKALTDEYKIMSPRKINGWDVNILMLVKYIHPPPPADKKKYSCNRSSHVMPSVGLVLILLMI